MCPDSRSAQLCQTLRPEKKQEGGRILQGLQSREGLGFYRGAWGAGKGGSHRECIGGQGEANGRICKAGTRNRSDDWLDLK